MTDQEQKLPPEEQTQTSPTESREATQLPEQQIVQMVDAAVESSQFVDDALHAAELKRLDLEKITALQQRKRKAAIKLFQALNKVLPYQVKTRIFASAARSEQMSYAYIDSLDPTEDRYDLESVSDLYLAQYEAAVRAYNQTPDAEKLAALESVIAKLMYVISKIEGDYRVRDILHKLAQGSDEEKTEGEVLPAAGLQRDFTTEVLARSLNKQSEYNQRDIINAIMKKNSADVVQVLQSLSAQQRREVVDHIVYFNHLTTSESRDAFVKVLGVFEVEDRVQIVTKYFKELKVGEAEQENTEFFVHLRKVADSLPSDQRNTVTRVLVESWYQNPFSQKSGEQQLRQIVIITDDPQLRAEIFWTIAKDGLEYRSIEGLTLQQLIDNADGSKKNIQLIKRWAQEGLIEQSVLQKEAEQLIRKQFETNNLTIYGLVSMAERYGVEVSLFQDIYRRKVIEFFGTEKGLPSEVAEYAHLFEKVRLTGEWQEFDLDIQASQEYGERTWRKEQSIIDVLQNHLDAQDYRYATLLGNAAFSQDEGDRRGRGYSSYDLDKLVNFARRWPFPLGEQWKMYDVIPSQFQGKEAELAEKIRGLEKPQAPQVDILMTYPNGQEEWIPLDALEQADPTGEITGLRFQDNGLGYDKGLNALFAPTKQGLSFLRGRFGQGAKMSMIALLREGCQVEISSRAVVEETGEIMEWSGSPYLSESTQTVGFRGKQRRLLNPEDIDKTGTITEIRFANANKETIRIFRQMVDSRVGEGLGQYVLEYHPLRETFVYGSTQTQTSLSVAPQLEGRVFVQGLEVPKPSLFDLAFCYNFGSGEVLTGRDRTYLERDKVEEDVKAVWEGISDHDAITALYKLWLPEETPSFSRARYSLESRLSTHLVWRLSETALPMHATVISELLHISETDTFPIVFSTSKELAEHPDARERLKQAGYPILIDLGYSPEGVPDLVAKVLGKERVKSLSEVWRDLENIHDNEELTPSEKLRQQYHQVVADGVAYAKTTLQHSGLENVPEVLDALKIQQAFRYSDRRYLETILNISSIRLKEDDYKVSGYTLTFYPQHFTQGEGIPDELSPADLARLKFEVESQLLRLTFLVVKKVDHLSSTEFHLGQDLANKLLEVDAGKLPAALEAARAISIESPELQHQDLSADALIEQDKRVIEVRDLILAIKRPDVSVELLKSTFDQLRQLTSEHPELQPWVVTAITQLQLIGQRYYDGTGAWQIKKSNDAGGLPQLEHLDTRVAGSLDGAPIYVLGSGEDVTLAVPYDFSKSEVVVVRANKREYPISKYKKKDLVASVRYGASTPGKPEELFEGTDSEQRSYFQTNVYVENGLIIFPVASYNSNITTERIEYFTSKLDIHLYTPGESEAEERHRGESYISTSATTEYGSGKVWDDPIRIFGDILQNHLDAGNVKILYRLEGREELVDQGTLLLEENKDAKIIGIQIEDDGTGYTTQGLSRWGDSPKRMGGKKGRFGEGLKMLSVACARNNLELTCSSRDWEAHVTTRKQDMVVHGTQREMRVVGFDMDWREEPRVGSLTQLSIPEGKNYQSIQNTWERWMSVLDPRQEADESGNRGLARYVRELRKESSTAITVGPVTFLTEDRGRIFERGLIVPGAAERMGKKYLFGFDFDADIIVTQERNVVDESKVNALISEAFRQAPYELCKRVMQAIHDIITTKAASDALAAGNIQAVIEMLGAENDENPYYVEFGMLQQVADIEVLRLAYLEVFGSKAVLSSMEKAERELSWGTKRIENNKSVPLTEQDRAFLNGLIHFEKYNFPAAQLVVLGKKYGQLIDRLEPHVHSTREIFEGLFKEPIPLTAEQSEAVQQMIQKVAGEMFRTFSQLNDTTEGKRLLTDLMTAKDREKYEGGRLNLAEDELEYAMKFLLAVSLGILPIESKVLHKIMGVGGFVHGSHDITYSAATLENPNETVATTVHELLHLAFQTSDYNPTFYSLLLLANPDFAARHTAPPKSPESMVK